MTFQRPIALPDAGQSADAFAVIGGSALPVAAAGADTLAVEGILPEGLAFPAEIRVVRSGGDETLSLRLRAPALLPQTLPGRLVLAIEPADPTLWAAIADSLADRPPVHIGALIALSGTPGRPSRRRRPTAVKAVLAAAILVFGAIVGGELYARAFVADAGTSFVSIDLRQLRSPATGRVVFLPGKTAVAAGEPVLGVTQRSGRDVIIESPCDCVVVGLPASSGMPVQVGQPVVFLAEKTARPFVVAGVERDLLFRLSRGAQVRLAFADGTVLRRDLGPIRLATVPEPAAAEDGAADAVPAGPADDLVYIAIEPGDDLPLGAVGSEVRVTFDTFAGTAVGRLLQPGDADAGG